MPYIIYLEFPKYHISNLIFPWTINSGKKNKTSTKQETNQEYLKRLKFNFKKPIKNQSTSTTSAWWKKQTKKKESNKKFVENSRNR